MGWALLAGKGGDRGTGDGLVCQYKSLLYFNIMAARDTVSDVKASAWTHPMMGTPPPTQLTHTNTYFSTLALNKLFVLRQIHFES